jgi:hypothetical protein
MRLFSFARTWRATASRAFPFLDVLIFTPVLGGRNVQQDGPDQFEQLLAARWRVRLSATSKIESGQLVILETKLNWSPYGHF